MILGIDFSLNGTGLSMVEGNKVVDWRLFTLDKKLALEDDRIILIPDFEDQTKKLDWVCETINDYVKNADFISLEQQIGLSFSWADGYAIIKYLIRKQNKPYIMVAPTSLKAYAGSGKADKIQMSYFLRKDYNLDFDYIGEKANNIVDAAWLALLGAYFQSIYIFKNIKSTNKVRNTIIEKIAQKSGYLNTNKRERKKNGRKVE